MKYRSLLLMLCACASTDTDTVAQSSTELATTGWVASASPDAEGASRAIDGDTSTRFSTGTGMANGQWFEVDMGACHTIDRVVMDSGFSTGDYARGYQIYVSNDGASWGSARASGTPSGSPVDVSFSAASGRYLRIVQTGSTGYWWSIAELHVFGTSCGGGSSEIPRGSWNASASTASPWDAPANAIDGNAGSRFSTDTSMAPGQWFQVNLGGCYAVDRVLLDSAGSPGDYPRGYQIYASSDGASWGAAVASGNPGDAPVDVSFGAKDARYVRVVQTGSAGNWWSIHEMRAFGAASSSCGSGSGGGGGRFRVISWNTHNAENPWGQTQKLGPFGADVIFLQEVSAGAADSYLNGMNSYEASVGSGKVWTKSTDGMLLTWHPVNGTYEIHDIGQNSWPDNYNWADNPHRTGAHALVDINGVAVNFFATHLDWNPNGDMTNHIANRNAFLSWTEGFSGLEVAGGDLNAWTWGDNTWEGNEQRNTVYAFDAHWPDVCSSLRGGHDTCYNDPTLSNGFSPDYVYRTASIAAVGYQVVSGAGYSDHNIVIADLSTP